MESGGNCIRTNFFIHTLQPMLLRSPKHGGLDWLGMWTTCEGREMFTGLSLENQKERYHLEELGIDARIILTRQVRTT